MRCPNCETENRQGAKFCDECGFPLVGADGKARPPAAGQDPGREAPAGAPGPQEAAGAPEPSPDGERMRAAAQVPLPDGGIGSADPGEFAGTAGVTEPIGDLSGFDAEPAPSSGGFSPADGDAAGWTGDHTAKMPRVEGAPSQQSADFRAGSAKGTARPRKGVAVLVAALAVAVLLAALAAALAFGVWGGRVVPDVIGMTEPDAESALGAEGFTARSTQVKSDDIEGLVLLMDPAPGTRAQEGSEVVIHIATSRTVPEVAGKSSDEAKALLAEVGYENIVVEAVKSDGEEGVVVSVEPTAGTRAKSGAAIVLGVTEAYRVPDVRDLEIEEAREAVRDAGFSPIVEYVESSKYIDGTVLGTTPDAGTKAPQGEEVTINVARDRAAELEELTEGLLSPGSSVSVGGYDYDIESLDYVSYEGDDTVAYRFTGRPKVTLLGEILRTNASRVVEGEVTWSKGNEVVSIS